MFDLHIINSSKVESNIVIGHAFLSFKKYFYFIVYVCYALV